MSVEPTPSPVPSDSKSDSQSDSGSAIAKEMAELHVLATLESDGSRRWLHPRIHTGYWWHRRRILAYGLMVVFVLVPHLRFHGKPLLLLDIASRQFICLGTTFLPSDTGLLALLMLIVFMTIMFLTSVTGRVWCGWACPQTVYMEFLFRPIDRLFEGTRGKGGKPRDPMSGPRQVGRVLTYLVLSMFLAHTFLAYFVGTERLAQWMHHSPWQHPTAFLVMGGTTIAMLYHFLYFREQLCTLACPYGRFQSVMLDENSLIVAYDDPRGEPRRKGKHRPEDNAGDCVDCHQCVAACPTGIDIRNGLQMECVNCTQCIDACDMVMDRIGKPQGLIRYSSQKVIQGSEQRLFRARTVAYAMLLLIATSVFVYALSNKSDFDARIVGGNRGAPFTRADRGLIANGRNLRLVNRTDSTRTYTLTIASPRGVTLTVVDPDALTLDAQASSLVPLELKFSSALTFGVGNVPAKLEVKDDAGNVGHTSFSLVGPR